MQRIMLKSKIYNVFVTGADLHYEGSITIDKMLLNFADIYEYEQVHVLDVTNGKRFITYAINGEPGEICVNGAASKLVEINDQLIILAYAEFDEDTDDFIKPWEPTKIDALKLG
jgi:aspartate 1-decarboxylase